MENDELLEILKDLYCDTYDEIIQNIKNNTIDEFDVTNTKIDKLNEKLDRLIEVLNKLV